MKSLLIIFLITILMVSCSTRKSMIESPKPKPIVVLTSDSLVSSATAGEYPIMIEPEISKSLDNRGEGIGTGNPHSIGHGSVHNTMIKNNRYNETSDETESVKCYSVPNETSISLGEVAYNIPTEMKVRETYQVTLRIGKASVELKSYMGDNTKTAIIPISETMEVELIDPSPKDNKLFDFVADNNAVQMVDTSGTYTQWSWNVTPIRTGNGQLKIRVSKIVNGNKKEIVYEDKITVKVNPWKQIGFWVRTYWQWSLTTLLIPIFKYLWPIWVKRREENDKVKKKKKKA